MKIKISVLTYESLKVYDIDEETQTFTINGQKIDTNIRNALFFINQICSNWPDNLENNTYDGLIVKIVISADNHKKIFHFKNKFPEDFVLLMQFLNEVENV